MIFLGIRVAINPSSAPDKIAWGLGLVILIATGGILIGYINTKSFNKKNLKSIIETFLFTALGVFLIIFSDVVGFVLEEIICVIIIINSIMNLVSRKACKQKSESYHMGTNHS